MDIYEIAGEILFFVVIVAIVLIAGSRSGLARREAEQSQAERQEQERDGLTDEKDGN